ncbi:MAG TPA: [protein-PII] uridylyltransferase [Euzebyales bacterium]|nr:[protein-PII] uridylyltransferase [Euzebyales bacterium]
MGPQWCRAWTDELDAALGAWLAVDAPRAGGLTLAALGSYARREVCPLSDVDLLVLHDGWSDDDLEQVVRSLCYPLWDAGLRVGYAVHTPKTAVRAAGDRIDTATALQDRRLVWGDPGLLDQVASAYGRWLRRRSGKVLTRLAAADDARHRRAGAQPGMLEPEVKSGAGGLRDLHSLRWASGMVLGEPGLRPLVGARYLGATDHRALQRANAELLTVRCALHLCTSMPEPSDVLRLDQQDEVAKLMGAGSADEVLSRVNLAMRTVAHVHGRTWPLLLADARSGRRRGRASPVPLDEDIALVDGLVEIDDDRNIRQDPALAMRTMAAAARHRSHLGRATVTRLQHDLAGVDHLPWDQRVRAAFLAALRAGPEALPALADADHIGLLAAHLPEWRRVRGYPQRNPYHRYDLDTHLVQTVSWVQRIADGELGQRLAAVYERLNDPDVLLLGALFHDVGKAWDGDHAVVGAQIAGRWISSMGFDQRRAQRVARLVRLHLLLPDVAQHRDLDERGEIQAVADRVVDTETLDALLVLSLADARATGPSAYSPWKDGLLSELHARARRALTGGSGGIAVADPETKVVAARDRSDEVPPGAMDRLLADPPDRYLLAADVDQLVEHARMLAWLEPSDPVAVTVRENDDEETAVISLVGWDRRGLLVDVVGTLAGLGLDVLEARAFTRRDAAVLDWIVVRRRANAPAPALDQLIIQVEAAGRGTADVERSVSRQERRWDERPGTEVLLIEPGVVIDRGPRVTRIEVEGRDAPGVLFRLLRVLADAGLDVSAARVATLGPQVRDVFFVDSDDDVDWDDLAAQLRTVVSATSDP